MTTTDSTRGLSLGAIADVIAMAVKEATAPLDARLKALESGEYLKFAGAWDAGKSYTKGDVTLRQSALRICRRPTDRAPGASVEDWQLILKSPDR